MNKTLSHAVAALLAVGAASASADNVINDDLIVTFSECVGNDCVNGESFGFDTLRLKENNLRIHFDDTSTSASFPRNDWRITINETSNGGQNKFSIDDATAGRTPFTIEAGAPNHSLYVDDGGRLGLGTSTPVADVHARSGNTPTLRLEQDGSSGFTPQTWDVAGNEAGFFVRDVTNGSQLPFRIIPGADSQSLVIGANNDVGVGGDTTPEASLHVKRTNGTAQLLVEEASATAGTRVLMHLKNKGATQFDFENTAVTPANYWRFTTDGFGDFVLTDLPGGTSDGVAEVKVFANGNMSIAGTLTENSSRTVKQGFAEVDPHDVLARVSQLPISTWSYTADTQHAVHIGPMAEDFYSVFGYGGTDKGIAPRNLGGVALAAIKGLNDVVKQKDGEIAELNERLAKLEALVQKSETAGNTSL